MDFLDKCWTRFPASKAMRNWIETAKPYVAAALADPRNDGSFLCGRTWFVGTNALPNDARGAIGGGPKIPAGILEALQSCTPAPAPDLDRGQISICFPGYPKPNSGETDASYRFRRKRDGGHLDGLMAEGKNRRRYLREHHAFVLGVPLADIEPGLSPLVVWEGSHRIIRNALQTALAGTAPQDWHTVDVTEAYHAARREVFETCARVEITSAFGEAYLVHRLAVHGIAPWGNGTDAAKRAVIYFRPACLSPEDWLRQP